MADLAGAIAPLDRTLRGRKEFDVAPLGLPGAASRTAEDPCGLHRGVEDPLVGGVSAHQRVVHRVGGRTIHAGKCIQGPERRSTENLPRISARPDRATTPRLVA